MKPNQTPSSALPFGSITLFSSRSPFSLTSRGEDDSKDASRVLRYPMGAGLDSRQPSRGWAEVMRGLWLRLATPRIRRCGLIGYTTPSVLQEALDWENNRVNQVDRIAVELNRRDRAKARCEWEHNYATACWVRRGWAIDSITNRRCV